jgi:hypothetical protein
MGSADSITLLRLFKTRGKFHLYNQSRGNNRYKEETAILVAITLQHAKHCVIILSVTHQLSLTVYPLRQQTASEYWRKLAKDSSQAE